MKNILLLLLFISGVGFGQPILSPPNNLAKCDANNDGFETFNLSNNTNVILGSLDPTEHSLNYHLTLSDANSNSNPIVGGGFNFTNTIQNTQTIYVRVTKLISLLYSITSFQINVYKKPIAYPIQNQVIIDSPFDGFATFNLTNNNSQIIGSQTNIASVKYYTDSAAAEFNGIAISNPTNYNILSLNQQPIFARIENNQGCFNITSFNIIVHNPFNVYIENANLKNALLTTNCADFNNDNILDGDADTNNDGEIQVNEALAVKQLVFAPSNSLTFEVSSFVGIEAFVNLTKLNFGWVRFITFNNADFTMLSQLEFLEFNHSSTLTLTNINLSNLSNLTTLNLINHRGFISPNSFAIANLNLAGCNGLQNFNYYNSSLNINFCQIPNLKNLDCSYLEGGEPETFDFSCLTQLQTLNISENNINKLILKNGSLLNTLNMSNLYSFPKYICTDGNPLEIAQVQSQLSSGYTTVINQYCSFVPGGLYNTISGTARFDLTNNGCDNSDLSTSNLKINISSNVDSGSTFANNLGIYKFYPSIGNFTIKPQLENPTYFNIAPPTVTFTFPAINGSTIIQDFCITPNGFHNDAEIVLVALDQPRPGFNCRYQIILKNKGNNAFSQEAKFNFDSNKMSYVSSNEPIYSQTSGQITFYNGIAQKPFEVRMYECVMRINAPTDTSPVNSGNIINSSASSFNASDDTPEDNLSSLSQIAVNSFDPNEVTCLEGDNVNPTKIGQYLHYNINFENTGTADAVNIVVKDVIDNTKFDINSLQVIYASGEVQTNIKENVAEFIFKNINLAKSNGGPGGHGNVLFKIKTLSTLPINTEVKNKANIYFDYNFPIITNEAKTTFAVLSNSGFVLDNSISVYPNPANSKININLDCNDNLNCKNSIKSIEIYDVQGRILETIIENKNVIDISNKSNGIYFLKINTVKGSKVERIIKE